LIFLPVFSTSVIDTDFLTHHPPDGCDLIENLWFFPVICKILNIDSHTGRFTYFPEEAQNKIREESGETTF